MTIRPFFRLGQPSQCVIALALCLCVIMQMLGAPVTLLSVEDPSDYFSGSVLEGFSLPQMLSPLTRSSESVSVVERPRPAHLLVLASEQFHPPAM
jgi:hypothetical protein